MGGSIEARSTPRVGSRFRFVLPLDRAGSLADYDSRTTHAGTAALPRTDRGLRVLLAEDHPTNQRVVQLILGGQGAEVIIADDGAQAVAAFEAGTFDVVLMDMQMPVMDGLAATRAIRNQERLSGLAPTPIIALSANAMDYQIASYREAGCDDYIAKPIDLARLANAIDRLTQSAAIAPVIRASGTSGSL